MTVALRLNGEMPSWVKVAVVLVSLGDHNRLSWPLDGKFRVVPPNATTIIRFVEFVDKVKGLGVFRQREKAMCKAFRNIHHAVIFSRQICA